MYISLSYKTEGWGEAVKRHNNRMNGAYNFQAVAGTQFVKRNGIDMVYLIRHDECVTVSLTGVRNTYYLKIFYGNEALQMEGFFSSFIGGVASGIAVAIIVYVVNRIYQWWRTSKDSPYSGRWEGDIYDITPETETGVIDAIVQNGKPIKHDIYQIKHNKKTGIITGTIRRESPTDQNHRAWNFTGLIDGKNYIIFAFWSKDGSVKSNGCVYAELIGDYKYVGYYLEEHEKNRIDKTPIMLTNHASKRDNSI